MSAEDTCSCPCRGPAEASAAVPTADKPAVGGAMMRSEFRIPGMDCPSEEQMIRLRLSGPGVASLEFDLPRRHLTVCHSGEAADLLARLVPLGYGAEWVASTPIEAAEVHAPAEGDEARVLWLLLAINAAMFVVEVAAGWLRDSAGLLADGADMLADAAVYGVALYAVGRSASHKLSAARLAGVLQLVLALGALSEVARRALGGSQPDEFTMIGISLLALVANIACLLLISRHRGGGVHMRASYIFSANDVLANLGVVAAGGLVAWTGSPIPDWTIGALIAVLVFIGAIRILRLR